MKVSKTVAANKINKAKQKKATSQSSDFIRNLEDVQEINKPGSSVETGAVGAVAAAFSLQEVGDALDHPSRKYLISRSSDLLDQLEILRIALLAGVIPKEMLTALGRKLREKRLQSDDPKLNQIIEEIELRAEVEIAKLSRPIK